MISGADRTYQDKEPPGEDNLERTPHALYIRRISPRIHSSRNAHQRTRPGPSVLALVGLCSNVIEMYAPIHEPEAAKHTYTQFLV